MNGIEIRNITKRYKNVTALDNISASLAHGRIYGLLGRNGAGKSTLINIMANRIFADEGEIFIDGENAKENSSVHEKIFCMSEADLYDDSMKVKNIFRWTGEFYDSFDGEKALQLAEKFQLDVNKRFKALSKGYQSICKLIVALSLGTPYVVFDEPVLGLDANHREMFYHMLLENYEENGQTIILATHLIEEVASLIEEVVIIEKGQILLQKNVDELMEEGYCVSGLAGEVDAWCRGKNVIGSDELGNMKLVYILGEREELPAGSHLQISGMNLQKLFVKLTEEGGNLYE